MFSSISTTLTLLAAALTVSAAPLEERQAGYQWHVSKFDARCANGLCDYSFQVTGPTVNGLPAFMATCLGNGVARNDVTLRNCSLNRGNLQGIEGVQAYMQLRPRAPDVQTKLHIEMKYNDGRGAVTWYEGTQTGTYQTFRGLSISGGASGEFDIVPLKTKAVA